LPVFSPCGTISGGEEKKAVIHMRKKLFATLVVSVLLGGCGNPTVLTTATTSKQETVHPAQTFAEILKENSGKPIQGKEIAELPSTYSPSPDLYHYAFVDDNDKATYVYAEDAQHTVVVSLDENLNVLKRSRFDGYQLKRAVRQDKILYIGYNDDRAIKYNMDSFDYSEVSKDELDRTRQELDKDKLPDGETPILMKDGYIYTKEGVLFDQKSQEYVMKDGQKLKLYDSANFGVGSFIYSIEARADGSLKVTLYKANGGDTSAMDSYVFPLQLTEGYDMNLLEFDMTDKGDLLIFAIGDHKKGKDVPVIDAFKIPFGEWMAQSKDVHADRTIH
jgi:hypothetical protein